jgi:hypothetical protein
VTLVAGTKSRRHKIQKRIPFGVLFFIQMILKKTGDL